LLTGVADAYLDHAPLVTITGQASLNRRHKESHQYIDTIAMFKPVTKWNVSIPRADVIPEAVRKAFKIAQTEKPGRRIWNCLKMSPSNRSPMRPRCDRSPCKRRSCRSRRPPKCSAPCAPFQARSVRSFWWGTGVIRRNASEVVRSFARAFQIPVLQTFMAKGVMP
jgi:acetolactate synthase-1/2/3 large subunit